MILLTSSKDAPPSSSSGATVVVVVVVVVLEAKLLKSLQTKEAVDFNPSTKITRESILWSRKAPFLTNLRAKDIVALCYKVAHRV